ncbi:MAG TPA: DUF3570 domain-containing protein [Candidatus Tenderia sp.]|nr:DUF3570 domain-containing protein [Candidatus Tenderia sp.]
MVCLPLTAAVLPEDRADFLFHHYEGGGVTINGPSIQARKQLGQSVSVSGNYYVDSISSASIDVVTTASPYQEEREEMSLGVDVLHDNVTISSAVSVSEENDFEAKTFHFTISQDMLGDLTTVSLGYSRGWDTVGQTMSDPLDPSGERRIRDPNFNESANRQTYRFGLTQVLTKKLIASLAFDTVTDEGYLNNPYRSVRFLDATNPDGFDWQGELYPRTRTSRAASVRFSYYLPNRAALQGEYRLFNDSWNIEGRNIGLKYVWPLQGGWLVDFGVRRYQQSSASFFVDLMPYASAQSYYGRDKELSAFSNTTLGVGVSYDLKDTFWKRIHRGTLNFKYDRISFDYDEFRDLSGDSLPAPGSEPLYSFSANVFQAYLSIWY